MALLTRAELMVKEMPYRKMSDFKSFTEYAIWSVKYNAHWFARQREKKVEKDHEVQPMSKPAVLFCADCKFSDPGEYPAGLSQPQNWICTHPAIKPRYDLVSGKAYPQYCSHVRMGDQCGPAGRLWEPTQIDMLSEGPY